jgi:hypothetical protein
VVYITALTLLIFLIFRIPGLAALKIFEKEAKTQDSAGGITAFAIGALTLGVQYWAGPSHMLGGTNYADAFHTFMTMTGFSLIILAVGLIVWSFPVFRPLGSRQAHSVPQTTD